MARMSCLFIYNDEQKLTDFRAFMGEVFPNYEYFTYNTLKTPLEEVMKALPSVSGLIISPCERTHVVSFIVGYVLGRTFPVYCAQSVYKDSHKALPKIYNFDSEEEMFAHIRANASTILREDAERISKAYLYEHGIPFTINNFISFLIKSDKTTCDHFIAAGMSVDSRDASGTPLLNIACRKDKVDMVEYLIKKGAKIDAVSTDREYTPLMDAVWRGDVEAARLLIKEGADVNKVSKEGQTMIVLAVGAEKIELCRLLAQNGADVDTPDAMGMSAYGYATLFKKQEIINILQPYHKE